VAEVCARYDFVRLHHHDGASVAAARNFCSRIADDAELLVNVDDDVYVYPDAIERLVKTYEAANGWRVVAGSVNWGVDWSRPIVMRRIGWGRYARDGEKPDFLVGAFFAYPRALALSCPWIETVRRYDDRLSGSFWKAKGVELLFDPDARAEHDSQLHSYGVEFTRDHIYANLFDALLADPSLKRLLYWETLGFLSGFKAYFRPGAAWTYVKGWVQGHILFARHWPMLRASVRTPLPPPS
jgi:glycosyltransferase involved in cell wall biosynthesis